MKKKSITFSILIGLSISLLFVNTNVAAAAPSWVGVSVGDAPGWTISLNPSKMFELIGIFGGQELIDEMNAESPYGDIDTLLGALGNDLLPSLTLKLSVESISELQTSPYGDYVSVLCSPIIGIPGVTEINLGAIPDIGMKFNMNMLDPDTVNWTMNTFQLMGYLLGSWDQSSTIMPFGLLFVPTTVNWDAEAQFFNDLITSLIGSTDNISVSAIEDGYGLQATMKAGTYNASQTEDATFKLSYDSKGVLGNLDVTYGVDTILKLEPTPPGNIPGFEIPILISIGAIATIGVIFYVKKKKVNINI